MNYPKLAFCYYPTTTLIIDDDYLFLESIRMKQKGSLPIKLYSDVNQALFTIDREKIHTLNINKIINNLNDDEITYENGLSNAIDINLSCIHEQIFDLSRSNQISLIIVDYHMPGMDGIEFCRCIKNHPAKKLLLTGQADLEIAVSAFNEGLIDKFIMKSEPHLGEILIDLMQASSTEYFNKLLDPIAKILLNEENSPFHDMSYNNFITSYLYENKFKEYYMYDKHGSYLCTHNNNSHDLIIIRNEKEIHESYELSRDNGIQSKFSKQLFKKEKILFFPNKNLMKKPIKYWPKYMLPAKKIAPNSQNYFSVIPNYTPSTAHN